MPSVSTVFRWLTSNVQFREQYEIAIQQRAAVLFEEMLDIADAGSSDVQRDRLRVDTRKWALAKMAPKKYGDRQVLEHSGGLTLEQLVGASLKYEARSAIEHLPTTEGADEHPGDPTLRDKETLC